MGIISFTLPEIRTWHHSVLETKREVALNSSLSPFKLGNGSLGIAYTAECGRILCALAKERKTVECVAHSGNTIPNGSCLTTLSFNTHTEMYWIASDGSIQSRYSFDHGHKWRKGTVFSGTDTASTGQGGAIVAVAAQQSKCYLFWIGRDRSVNCGSKKIGGFWGSPHRIAPAHSVDAFQMADLVAMVQGHHVYVSWVGPDGSIQLAECEDGSVERPIFNIHQVAPPNSANKRSGLHFLELADTSPGVVLFWVSQEQALSCAWNPLGSDEWSISTVDGPGNVHHESAIGSVKSALSQNNTASSRTNPRKLKRKSSTATLLMMEAPNAHSQHHYSIQIWYFTPVGALRCSSATIGLPTYSHSEAEAQFPWSCWSTVQHHPISGLPRFPRSHGRRRLVALRSGDGNTEVWYTGRDGKLLGYVST
jgi:hypothetical protein